MPTIHHGDCIETMNAMPPESVDAIVTDPPYGLGFMGKKWDDLPPSLEWAEACLRVLKPGGHLVAFGGSRTSHRLAVAIEDGGLEIRDTLMWLYGSGFPKGQDLGKTTGDDSWSGWNSQLKPAHEPIVLARKPLDGSLAANTVKHGVGGMNIDACRIGLQADEDVAKLNARSGGVRGFGDQFVGGVSRPGTPLLDMSKGRHPANVLLDEEAAAVLDAQTGHMKDGTSVNRNRKPGAVKANEVYGGGWGDGPRPDQTYGSGGGGSRFFYTAKASKKERPSVNGVIHPTVKPIAVMEWLIRLVTPPGGTVLDPFAGSGTTIEAAMREGVNVIGIEREAEYLPLIQHRIERAGNALNIGGIA